MQVIWVISALVFLTHVFEYFSYDGVKETLFLMALWSAALVAVQYIVFSSYNPFDLFDGSLKRKITQNNRHNDQ